MHSNKMKIGILGLSHKTAHISIREKLHFPEEKIPEELKKILSFSYINEAVVLSTCNRVEIIFAGGFNEETLTGMKNYLRKKGDALPEQLEKSLYFYSDSEAVRHLFRVSSSLDSMVVGEPQILGQVKDAYRIACENASTKTVLNKLLHKSFNVAKRVKNETKIGLSAVSVSFAAVELAKKIFGSLANKTVMLIGAGEMCELAARHFLSNGAVRIIVVNRTFSRAERLAEQFQGLAVPFEERRAYLHQADIILSSTDSPAYVILLETVKEAIKKRKNMPMFFIDIAVPRDIDPKINDIDNVYLYDIDDLQEIVSGNLKERAREALKAEDIVSEEVDKFYLWLKSRDVVPLIASLKEKAEEIRKSEFEKILGSLNGMDEKSKKAIEILSTSIVNKILHTPITRLKECTAEEESLEYIDALKKLFDLEDDT